MPPVQTILIIDGDAAMRETLREQLTHDNAFGVVEAASATEAEQHLASPHRRFAAVIVDAALPEAAGRDVCARIRAGGLSMPIILMNGSERSCAADDIVVIAKP